MKPTKQTKLLPNKATLQDLTQAGSTINDYSKATPSTLNQPTASVVMNLIKPPKGA